MRMLPFTGSGFARPFPIYCLMLRMHCLWEERFDCGFVPCMSGGEGEARIARDGR